MNVSAAHEQLVIADVDAWLRECVLNLSLCPYARAPYQAGRVRLAVAGHDALLSLIHI